MNDRIEDQADRLADDAVEAIAENLVRAMVSGQLMGRAADVSRAVASCIEQAVVSTAGDTLPAGAATTPLRDAIRQMALHRSPDILTLARMRLSSILDLAWEAE